MTDEARAEIATLKEQIEALESIVPSNLSSEDEWRRNTRYVRLDEVLKLLTDASPSSRAAAEPAPPLAADDILAVAHAIVNGAMSVTPGPSIRQLARSYIALRTTPPSPDLRAFQQKVKNIINSAATPLYGHNRRSVCAWCGAKWEKPDWKITPQPDLFGHPANDCLVWSSIVALTADPPSQETCADCGAPLNEGEAKCFTVCDDCWEMFIRLEQDKEHARLKDPALRDAAPPSGGTCTADDREHEGEVTRMDTPKVISDDSRTAPEASASGAPNPPMREPWCRLCNRPRWEHVYVGGDMFTGACICPTAVFTPATWLDGYEPAAPDSPDGAELVKGTVKP